MGRPVNYDEGAVVEAALGQFWAAGFGGSSVDMLVDATGLNKHSLYQAFGGKSGLFVRVLEHYLATYTLSFETLFDEYTGMAALKRYFQAALAGSDPRGCLIANTAVELDDSAADARRLVTDYYARLAQALARAIAQGQADGDIRAGLDAKATAQWLVRALQGHAVSSRLGGQRKAELKALLALLSA